MQQRFTFKKEERLTSKKVIDQLFASGRSMFIYPFRVLYLASLPENEYPAQVVFSVPKRSFKQAVKRNLLKRRMREAYRLNKQHFYRNLQEQNKKLSIIFIYVEKEIKEYAVIEKGMIKAMKQLVSKG